MTPRERMMTALRNRQPDRIPVAPDISNMIPARLTKKPFWDIYVNNDPALWKAYIDAIKYFKMDGWFTYGDLKCKPKIGIETENKIEKLNDRWKVLTIYHTPAGDVSTTSVCMSNNPPTMTEKMMKNIREDLGKIKYILAPPASYDPAIFKEQKRQLGELGMMAVGVAVPGLHIFSDLFEGSVEAATYAMIDYPDLFEELVDICGRQALRITEMAIDAGADSILTGGSGSITLQSPEIWRKLSLPTLKKITAMCRQADVISGVHSCGREYYMVEVCAAETDLDYINPLEIAPMGDCTLAECKRNFGDKLALMGNLHTMDVMLCGSADDVRLASLRAILDAGHGGGFVLSTGDQCGRDTPDENIFAMVEMAEQFGKYPLATDAIASRISELEH